MKKIFAVIFLVFLIENTLLLFPKIKALVIRKEESRVVRGWKKAEGLGCFSCHGPRGFGGVPNPKSEDDEVPSFKEGEPMMYAKNDKELREFILYGHKKKDKKERGRKKEKEKKKDGEGRVKNTGKKRPEVQKEKIPVFGDVNLKADTGGEKEDEGLIKMPAWRKWVSPQDVDDLIVFIKANAVMINPREKKLKKARDIVLNNGCFACHGPLGAGGIKNPGSFKGYVPSFIGKDFDELVKNRGELEKWIEDGKIKRLEKNFLARYFMRRQVIKMPAFEKVLTDSEIDSVIDYLNWLRKEGKKYG